MYKILICFWLIFPALADAAQAMRIVSSGGSITEIIYALGKQEMLVATDSTSIYPSAAAELPKLGYFRQLSVEGVLSFQPTHLIGAQATGPQELVSQLEAAGVKVAIMGEQRDINGLYQLINDLGNLVAAQAQAQLLIAQVKREVDDLKRQATERQPVSALFVMSDSERGLTVAGGNTVPQSLFNDAGVVNAAAAIRDYKVMDNESILRADPQVIFVASHNIQSEQARQNLCQHPALKATKAGRNCAIYAMDSGSALGLSPRYPQALETVLQRVAQTQQNAG